MRSSPRPPPWPCRRRAALVGLGRLPQTLCLPDRDASAITALLVSEGLVCPVGDGLHQITDAGVVLRAMHQLSDSESGPWGTTDLRRSRPVKQLDIDTLKSALDDLEARGLVTAAPTKRTPKWDLTTK